LRSIARGFSLIEMVVVLGILILLAAMIVPTIGPMRRQGRMRVGAATVAEALRLARSLAITYSTVYKIDFETATDPDEVRIYSGTGDKDHYDRLEKLPADVQFQGLPPANGAVCFYPDGSCSGNFTVRVQDAKAVAGTQKDDRSIEIKAASGRIAVSGGAR
jgi:prepilin-type N-terminal cleavage/methylation domain-containing protein